MEADFNFTLERQKVKLVDLNPRKNEDKMEADLRFELTDKNDILSEFHPSLKFSLYEESDQADLLREEGALTQRRFPEIGKIDFEKDAENYDLTVHLGVTGKSDLTLNGTRLSKFRFHLKDSGFVTLSFRVQCRVDARTIGILCTTLQEEIAISLKPAERPQGTFEFVKKE